MTVWKVFPALHEESIEGWIWVYPLERPTVPHVSVLNPAKGRRVVCEQRLIDDNFRRVYDREGRSPLPTDSNIVVISGYYRERLGLRVSAEAGVDLSVSPARGPFAGMRAGVTHPSSAIRTATWLGIVFGSLSVALGVLSVVLAVILR
jgi:hypothetical protein